MKVNQFILITSFAVSFNFWFLPTKYKSCLPVKRGIFIDLISALPFSVVSFKAITVRTLPVGLPSLISKIPPKFFTE